MDTVTAPSAASGPRFSRPQIAVGLIGLLLSLGAWVLQDRDDEQVIESAFLLDASEYSERITGTFRSNLESANSVSDLFVASERVTLEEFNLYCDSLLQRHPSVHALEWAPRVAADERNGHEQDLREQGSEGYAIKEVLEDGSPARIGDRDIYYPVAYVNPREGNERAIGLDLGFEPERRAALERAASTGEMSITKAVKLVQEPGGSLSILGFAPIPHTRSDPEKVPDSVSGRGGFTVAVLRIDDIIEDALKPPLPDLRYMLRDLTSSPPQTLSRSADSDAWKKDSALAHTEGFAVGGRKWQIIVQPSEAYLETHSSIAPIAVLGTGFAFTILLVILLGSMADQTRRIEDRITVSTARLRDANARLIEEISERNRVEDRLREMTTEVLLVEERERRRLAVDLHDGLGQLMSLIKMRLQMLPGAGDETVKEKHDEVTDLVDRSIHTIQTLTFQLTPPVLHELGLVSGLEWLAEDLEQEFGLHVVLEAEELPELGADTQVIVFRSVRELLINVAKHAETSEATVTVYSEGDRLIAIVSDEGRGFEADQSGSEDRKAFGLFAIEGRLHPLGGSLAVESEVGHGTSVRIELPI